MRIGILNAAHLPAELEAAAGTYPEMIRRALGPDYAYVEFDVIKDQLPQRCDADAYVITGSASGVHDPDHWIVRLRDWLRELDRETPLVGICFGHQIMAEAYGGAVETSPKGWGLGLHEYTIVAREKWIDCSIDNASSIVLPVSHRDQVVKPPPTTRTIAASDFCPYAALAYSDRRALSFQSHPEIAPEFLSLLIAKRQCDGVISIEQADSARASLRQTDHRSRVMGWIRQFLNEDGVVGGVM